MNEHGFHAGPSEPNQQDAFDLQTFETALAKKLETRPDLRAVHTGASALALVLIATGLWLGYKRLRNRRSAPAPAGVQPGGWGAALPIALLLFLPVSGAPFAAPLRALGFARGPALLVAGALGILSCAALGLVVAAKSETGLAPLGLARERRTQALRHGLEAWLAALPFVAALQLLTRALATHYGLPIHPNPAAARFLTTHSPAELAMIIAIALVLAPLGEELLFRGLLLPALRRKLEPLPAACISAALFAIAHPPIDMPAIFVLGLALAFAYERSASVIAPLVAHAINNAYGLGALALARYLAHA